MGTSENSGSMCCSQKCDSCEETLFATIPAGTFYRSYDGVTFNDQSFPATVDQFRLDRYEVTVARFRVFVAAGKGTKLAPPLAGEGAHPKIAGSGWDSGWDSNLAADAAALKASLNCASESSWVDTPGQTESLPINCVTWFEAFAFCAWKGKRLPTEAEWNYAAAGGDQQRAYPWSSPPSSTTIDSTHAAYGLGSVSQVGSRSPKGDGRWGNADLVGNVAEWVLDSYLGTYPKPCLNCAALGGRSGLYGAVAL